MPLSKRSVLSGAIVGELLITLLFISARSAEAGGTAPARAVLDNSYDMARERHRLLFGDEHSPDPVLLRSNPAGGDRINRFDDPENARHLKEILDGLEHALNRKVNEGHWLPFGKPDRKPTDPVTLFDLEPDAPREPDATDSWKDRFHFRLSRGLEYRQEWPTGERDRMLQMRISGPVVKDCLGLGFRLEGHMLDLPFQLKAYGGRRYDGRSEAGISFDLEF
jgi:hypothetical protein